MTSAPGNFKNRQRIRDTWAHEVSTKFISDEVVSCEVIFVLGIPSVIQYIETPSMKSIRRNDILLNQITGKIITFLISNS